MRYQPNVLNPDLSAQLTSDFARALADARSDSASVQQVQLQVIYDVLRSLAEVQHLGFAHHDELGQLEELMACTQGLRAALVE